MTDALHEPNEEELTTLLSRLCKDGLYKLGSCYVDLLGKRPFDSVHYDTKWFTRDPMCVATGITSKTLASMLETSGIQHLKGLGICVNVKGKDDVPHDGISAARPQALYIVRVVRTITTLQQFKNEHASYYKQMHGGAGLKEQRRAAGLPIHKKHVHDPTTRKMSKKQDPTTRKKPKKQDPTKRKKQDPTTRKKPKKQDPTTRKKHDPTTRKNHDPTTRKGSGGKQPRS